MPQIDVEKELHDEGSCNSHSCQYCEEEENRHLMGHDKDCKCKDCLEEKANYRYHKEENMNNPGSDAAIKEGCICDPKQNKYGKGHIVGPSAPMFFEDEHCKLHGADATAMKSIKEMQND